MRLSAIVQLCAVWGAMAGGIMGMFPGSRLASAIGVGLLTAAVGVAFLGAGMGTGGAAAGFLVGGILGMTLGFVRPFQMSAPGGVTAAFAGVIVLGIGGVVVGLIAGSLGLALVGGRSRP